jgi:hypothetical protein
MMIARTKADRRWQWDLRAILKSASMGQINEHDDNSLQRSE